MDESPDDNDNKDNVTENDEVEHVVEMVSEAPLIWLSGSVKGLNGAPLEGATVLVNDMVTV